MTLIVAGPTGAIEHDGGVFHPEQQSRIFAVMDGLRALDLGDGVAYPPTPKADEDDLVRVHSLGYLEELKAYSAKGGGDIDPDTYVRADSWSAATRAAGAGLAAIAALEECEDGVAFVPVRPPGHHAGRDRGMGFCLLNNVAVAAAALTAKNNRVLIVDWDVHHGNGTQAIFWDDPNVLFVSTHQFPLFPGTGKAAEVGGPEAIGLTLNVPLPAGATGDVLRAALDHVARPTIEQFAPDWVLVSCGFDAHWADPLGDFALSSGDFAELATIVHEFAPRPGRVALFLEGGYNQAALRTSVAATLGALLGVHTEKAAPTYGGPGMKELRSSILERDRAIEQMRTLDAGRK
jgi:acetoin utilization deacetylase AcuC-like enzyme